MKTRSFILGGLAGLVLGGFVAVVVVLAIGGSVPGIPFRSLNPRPEGLTGRLLMARVGETFIWNDRRPGEPAAEAGFYDTPRPSGRNLCAVSRYSFANTVTRVRPYRSEDDTEPSLHITTLYGVPPPTDDSVTHKAACARYRDFTHVVGSDNGEAIDRVVGLLREAKAGKGSFSLACRDRRHGAEQSCDGRAWLGALEVRRITMGPMDGGLRTGDDRPYYDDTVAVCLDDTPYCGKGAGFMIVNLRSRVPGMPSPDGPIVSIGIEIPSEFRD